MNWRNVSPDDCGKLFPRVRVRHARESENDWREFENVTVHLSRTAPEWYLTGDPNLPYNLYAVCQVQEPADWIEPEWPRHWGHAARVTETGMIGVLVGYDPTDEYPWLIRYRTDDAPDQFKKCQISPRRPRYVMP